MTNLYYILQGKEIVPATLLEWATCYTNFRVANTQLDNVTISTVFLGIDHNYADTGPPILFETMIFGGEHNQKCWRYATYTEAEQGHKEAVELVVKSLLI